MEISQKKKEKEKRLNRVKEGQREEMRDRKTKGRLHRDMD